MEKMLEDAIEAAESEFRDSAYPAPTNDRQAVEFAAWLLVTEAGGGYNDLAQRLRTSAEDRFPDQDPHQRVTSRDIAGCVLEAALPHLPLARLEKFLREHPREAAIVSFRPGPDAGEGKFLFSAQFGEEAPRATLEARAEAVREWVDELGLDSGDSLVDTVDDTAVRALLDRLEDVNAGGVLAGGAIYGIDGRLDVAVDEALRDARY